MKTLQVVGAHTELSEAIRGYFSLRYNVIVSKNIFPDADIVINLPAIGTDLPETERVINPLVEFSIVSALNIISGQLERMQEKGYGRILFVSAIPEGKDSLQDRLYESCRNFIDKIMAELSMECDGSDVKVFSIELSSYLGAMKWNTGAAKFGTTGDLLNKIEYLIEEGTNGEIVKIQTTPSCS